MVAPGERRILLLDACSVINLAACDLLSALASNRSFHVVDLVVEEALFIRCGGDGDDADERLPINLRELTDSGHIEVEATFSDEELLTFIDLTLDLDDGEALTLAVAAHRGYAVVTDDRKALRIARDELQLELVTSLELIRGWSADQDLPDDDVRKLLVALHERGRYIPPRSHPLRDWWAEIMTAE